MSGQRAHYAVAAGLRTGVFASWEEARPLVQGVSGARFKKFSSEADARAFLGQGPGQGPGRGPGRGGGRGGGGAAAPSPAPLCACGAGAVGQVVRKEGSKLLGQRFFGCATRRCKFFQLRDAPIVAPTAPIAISPETLILYTDGSCLGNTAVATSLHPAGWAYVALVGGDGSADADARMVCEGYGPVELDARAAEYLGAEVTSNNTAELSAIGEALRYLLRAHAGAIPHAVIRYDSEYAAKSATGEFNGAKNRALIEAVREMLARVNSRSVAGVQFSKVKGHSANVWNDRVDLLARRGGGGARRGGGEEGSAGRKRGRVVDLTEDDE